MNRLQHEDLFQVYKLMLDYAVDDDQLMRIVNSTLEHSGLKTPGEIVIKEFIQVCTSNKIPAYAACSISRFSGIAVNQIKLWRNRRD